MKQSEGIEKLATALCRVQTNPLFALLNGENPFFKSKYADLSSVWAVIREPLTKNGLCVAQTSRKDSDGTLLIVTTLMHESGQWIQGELPMVTEKNDPQAYGKCITYGRRYALSAIIGVCPEDDDGEGAMKRNGDADKPGTQKQSGGKSLGECPKCGAEAIIKGKEEYGGGWLCWKEKGGCNAKFTEDPAKQKPADTEKATKPNLPSPEDYAALIKKGFDSNNLASKEVAEIATWYRKGKVITKAECFTLTKNWDAEFDRFMTARELEEAKALNKTTATKAIDKAFEEEEGTEG